MNKNKNIIDLIENYLTHYPEPVIIAIPNRFENEDYKSIYNLKGVSGLILPDANDTKPELNGFSSGWIHEDKRHWQIPDSKANTIIFMGQRYQISFFMLNEALTKGIYWIAYISFGELIREYIPLFSLGLIFNKLYQLLPSWVFPNILFYRTEKKLKAVINSDAIPLFKTNEFNKNQILIVNTSLLWGGAERQIVNTLTGLQKTGNENIALLCQHLSDRKDHDFYLSDLEKRRIKVYELGKDFKNNNLYNKFENTINYFPTDLQKNISKILSKLPNQITTDITDYLIAFNNLRPQIIHIWQDSTSVIAGLAASIIGIPRIILSSRNMAPYRFAFRLPYMRSGYRALADNQNIQFLNNSIAGAKDYEKWLGMPQNKFHILYNGINPDEFKRKNNINSYREQLGIPKNVKVIGSIFRFYKEKDPILWIKTAAEIAKKHPDCVFLLIGAGPMRTKILTVAKKANILNRLFLPGTEKDTVLPLSLMDVFLLTSRQEGTPNVVIEAQMCGVPVVATCAGGTADTVEHGVTGWIVNKRSPVLLADQVLYCLNNIHWLEKAKYSSREFSINKFDINHMIEETLKVYGIMDPGY